MIKEKLRMRSTRIPPADTNRPEDGDHADGDRAHAHVHTHVDDGQGLGQEAPARILVAEAEDAHLSAHASMLEKAGFQVDLAGDGGTARALLESNLYATIVADAGLSGLDAIGLLRAARRRDLDVPLVVIAGAAHVGLSEVAVQQGALCFLEKPVGPELLCATLSYAVKLHRLAKLRRKALGELGGSWNQLGDRVALEQVFERAFGCLSIAFQPIVSWSNRRVIGHEALLRSSDPSLPDPSSVLAVAERLGRIDQIGRLVRERVARSMARAPAEYVFVNLHAHELLDSELYSASAPLSQFGKRIVIEISEHALLDDVSHLESRAEALRKLGFRLAMDNLGPGYPGLSSFARLRPEFVKYDLSLVRGIDRNPAQAEILAEMTALLVSMNTRVIAAGIESIAQRDAVVQAGVDLLQGFAFSKPDMTYRQPDLG
jgi:EAL domain-containing protein (putative c-di-GMP-specific phosphodiesterase class I)/ActR/RegA family two-component response regulator